MNELIKDNGENSKKEIFHTLKKLKSKDKCSIRYSICSVIFIFKY